MCGLSATAPGIALTLPQQSSPSSGEVERGTRGCACLIINRDEMMYMHIEWGSEIWSQAVTWDACGDVLLHQVWTDRLIAVHLGSYHPRCMLSPGAPGHCLCCVCVLKRGIQRETECMHEWVRPLFQKIWPEPRTSWKHLCNSGLTNSMLSLWRKLKSVFACLHS